MLSGNDAVKKKDRNALAQEVTNMDPKESMPIILDIIDEMLVFEQSMDTRLFLQYAKAEIADANAKQNMNVISLGYAMFSVTAESMLQKMNELVEGAKKILITDATHQLWSELAFWLEGLCRHTYRKAPKSENGKAIKENGFFKPIEGDWQDELFKGAKGLLKLDVVISYRRMAKEIEKKLEGFPSIENDRLFKVKEEASEKRNTLTP